MDVHQCAATKDEVVVIDRYLSVVIGPALETTEEAIWRTVLHLNRSFVAITLNSHISMPVGQEGLLQFQVSLAIQALSFHEGSVLSITGLHDQDITGHEFLLMYPNNISNH